MLTSEGIRKQRLGDIDAQLVFLPLFSAGLQPLGSSATHRVLSEKCPCRHTGCFFIKLTVTLKHHREQLALIQTQQETDRLLVLFVGVF